MKKVVTSFIAVLFVGGVLMLSGCGNKETKEEKLENIFDEYAVHYYDKYQKGIGAGTVSVQIVTIEALKIANEKAGENYDLDKLKDCELNSEVRLTINLENSEITNKEFNMNCN